MTAAAPVRARIDHTVTAGTFSLDGQTFDVDNNVWVIGDTLFNGGPGATGRSFSDHDQIVTSINQRLMSLPDDTTVKPGHGDDTTITAERDHIQ